MTQIKREKGSASKSLDSLINGIGDREGRVGWFESSKYENGTPVASVAAIQEFGSPVRNIPPRSFMRSTILEKRDTWKGQIKKASIDVLKGRMTAVQAMGVFAEGVRGNVQEKIATIQSPPLSPLTLALRKVKMGQVPGLGPEVTGRTVGVTARMLAAGEISIEGVPDKPLIEPASIAGGGTLFHTIEAHVK